MKHLAANAIVTMTLLFSVTAEAKSLVCARDETTFRQICFSKNGVRSNGKVRAAKLYQGGPNNVTETSYTARVHCGSGVLELTDRAGIAFARNVPDEQLGRDFVRFLCEHTSTKPDPKLNTK